MVLARGSSAILLLGKRIKASRKRFQELLASVPVFSIVAIIQTSIPGLMEPHNFCSFFKLLQDGGSHFRQSIWREA